MAIKINNQDLQARYINGNSIGKVMLNGGQIRPATIPPEPDPNEYIRYSYTANSLGSTRYIVIPTGGIGHDGNHGCPYNWNVRYRKSDGIWGQWTNYSGTSSSGGYFTINVPSLGTYYIDIKPVSDYYGRALAFSWHTVSSSFANRVYGISYDSTYKGYAVSATDTGDYFRAYQWENCYYNADETLPNTVTTIGDYFRAGQYKGGKYRGRAEVLPDSVTSIGDYFRYQQYYNCKNTGGTILHATPVETMSSNITAIGDGFRLEQFAYSDMVTTAGTEVLPNGILTIGDGFRKGQYSNCPFTTTSTAIEVLPDSVTSIGKEFRSLQYWNTGVTTITGWKDLSVNGVPLGDTNYRLNQFYQDTIDTITVTSDVGYNMAGDVPWAWISYVSAVNVPNAYLSNFQTTTVMPRDWVTPKSLFVGY